MQSSGLIKNEEELRTAAEKMMKGDFSVRVPYVSKLVADDRFNDIIDCINTMAEELENTEMLRNDFINNFSHEFKTPIVSIRGFARQLRSENLSEEQRREYLDTEHHQCADHLQHRLYLGRK